MKRRLPAGAGYQSGCGGDEYTRPVLNLRRILP